MKRLAKADFDLAAEMYLTVVDKTVDDLDGDEPVEAKKQTLIKDLVNVGGKKSEKVEKKFTELTEVEIETMRVSDKAGYGRIFKAHYGFEPIID